MKKSQNRDPLFVKLGGAAKEKNKSRRGLAIAAVISEALKPLGIKPILVGGSAVAYYTDGAYTTHDVDMIAPTTGELKERMISLGFKKIGKDFINDELSIYIEFPSDSIGRSEKSDIVNVGNVPVRIISIEDLIVDRLCAFKFWRSGVDGVNTMIMLEQDIGDRARIEARASEEDVLDALDYIENAREEIIRKKISTKGAGELLMKYFKKKG